MTTVRPSAGLAAAELDVRLGERLAALVGVAPAVGGLAAATVPVGDVDPVALFAAAAEADLEAALWLRPAEGTALVGIGRAWAVEAAGPGRFREAEEAWRALVREARLDGAADGRGGGPVLLGGMGFSGRRPAPDDPWAPFGPSSLVLPELLLAVAPDGTRLTGSLVTAEAPADARALERRWDRLAERARALDPGRTGMVARPVYAPLAIAGEQPSEDGWKRLVGMFAGAVGRGRLDKVVLARRVGLRSPVELDVPNALRRLAASAPESTTYAFRRDGRTFLGATPERLVRTEGRSFRTVAVAGTTGRGADSAEDAVLAAQLMASDKNREEQAIVVSAIRDQLAPIAETLEVAAQPSIMTLRFVQHLVTEISGTLAEGRGLLSLGGLLHPTPAVGGEPRDLALALLDEHEGFDRGWYAGPVGWLGADGDGELCVALRCGIVDRTRATLFAGCGIVADSDPDAEWEESRIKLRAVVSALGIPGSDL
ncbi:MAG: isochorismate synthase [Chloroflexota bacterium]